jgi:nitrate reductase cytochrome c-type subunit
LRKSPGKVGENLVGARYNCNQCHVSQTDAPALVGNTFSSGRAR